MFLIFICILYAIGFLGPALFIYMFLEDIFWHRH